MSKEAPELSIHQWTDVGQQRHENQDSMGYLLLDRVPYQGAHLLVVADGMGGASGGRLASTIAVREVLSYFQDEPSMEPDVALREAFVKASNAIRQHAEEEPSLTGMGTTGVMILVQHGYVFGAHVGDSRLYLFRDEKLHRLSRDHTAVQRLVEAGILSEEEAAKHPRGNVLSRVLGSEHSLNVELLAPPWKLLEGDRFMLCSDGLHGELSDDEIGEILDKDHRVDSSKMLVQAANEAGGKDNITVQVLAYDNASKISVVQGVAAKAQTGDAWFSFSDAPTGYLFNLLLLVLIFSLGYFFGIYAGKKQVHQGQALLQPQSRQLSGTPTGIPVAHRKLVAVERSMKPVERSMKPVERSMKPVERSMKPVSRPATRPSSRAVSRPASSPCGSASRPSKVGSCKPPSR